jgi:hypothetical protein
MSSHFEILTSLAVAIAILSFLGDLSEIGASAVRRMCNSGCKICESVRTLWRAIRGL